MLSQHSADTKNESSVTTPPATGGNASKVVVPSVARKHRNYITTRLKRAQSESNLSATPLSLSHADIMKSLALGGALRKSPLHTPSTPGSKSDGASDSDSDVELVLVKPVSAPNPVMPSTPLHTVSTPIDAQSQDKSGDALFSAADIPVVLNPNLSGVAPVSTLSAQSKKEVIESIKDDIANRLKQKIRDASGLEVNNDNDAIRRAISHVIEEVIEVIAWTPKLLRPIDAQSGNEESKDTTNVILHYKNPLFNTMLTAAVLAGAYDYSADRIFHRREIVFGRHLPKSLSGAKAKDAKWYEGANVIIPICIGFDGALEGVKLEEVLKFYRDTAKPGEITVYIGEYNRLEDPLNQLAKIGQEKREFWLKKNKEILHRYGVKVLLREDLIQTQQYKAAKAFVEKKLHDNELRAGSVMKDAQDYLDGRKKKSSPQLAAENGHTPPPPSSSLESDVVVSVVAGLSKNLNLKDKIELGLAFLEQYREKFKPQASSHQAYNMFSNKQKQSQSGNLDLNHSGSAPRRITPMGSADAQQ